MAASSRQQAGLSRAIFLAHNKPTTDVNFRSDLRPSPFWGGSRAGLGPSLEVSGRMDSIYQEQRNNILVVSNIVGFNDSLYASARTEDNSEHLISCW